MLIDNMVLKKPGADSQDWTHAALDVLERSLMGWINAARRLVLEEHLPRRKDPLKNCYYSTRGIVCDLGQLDSKDYIRYDFSATGKSDDKKRIEDSLQARLQEL